MGRKQLIYCHVAGQVWAFASEPQAVLRAQGIPHGLNEGRVAGFLESYLEGIDAFFEGVFRLPPAHRLTVDGKGIALRRYWTLTPVPELKLPKDAAYAQAFKDPLLSRDLAQRVHLAERVARYRRNAKVGMIDQATQRARTITATALTVGRERYDRVAADGAKWHYASRKRVRSPTQSCK